MVSATKLAVDLEMLPDKLYNCPISSKILAECMPAFPTQRFADENVEVPAKARLTTPAAKYGPTADYGPCEADSCSADARATCIDCDGHFCFGHAEHSDHGEATPGGDG